MAQQGTHERICGICLTQVVSAALKARAQWIEFTVANSRPSTAMMGTTASKTRVMLHPLEKATAMPATKVPTLCSRLPTFSPMAC